MLKRYHQNVSGLFRLTDAGIVGGTWLAAYWLRFNLPLIQITKGLPPFERYAALSPLVIAIWLSVFSYFRVYSQRRMLRRTDEAFLIGKAHLVSMFIFLSLTYLFSEYKYSRIVVLYFGLLSGILIVAFRLLQRNIIRFARIKGHHQYRVLALGEGSTLESLILRIHKFPELGLKVTGIITSHSQNTPELAGVPVVGNLTVLESYLAMNPVDQILICLPRSQYSQVDRILGQLKDQTVDIQLVPDIHEYITLGCAIEEFEGVPIVHINDSPLQGWGAAYKRTTDILLSALSLIILAPLFVLISLAVKLTSRGPVFYRQERMGLDGKTFGMLKFRSMKVDAETETGAVWARPHDDRRTPIGALLRSTSLDELPQLWNVLWGDMSLVGPRPERPLFVEKFRQDIPHYMLRHKVKAGITGWAQVNGWRGNTSLDRRIECDLYYIRNWSYALDLKIMLLTLWKGFINKNAY